jgi:hypothetical protein
VEGEIFFSDKDPEAAITQIGLQRRKILENKEAPVRDLAAARQLLWKC